MANAFGGCFPHGYTFDFLFLFYNINRLGSLEDLQVPLSFATSPGFYHSNTVSLEAKAGKKRAPKA
jgi:hypothetical protein